MKDEETCDEQYNKEVCKDPILDQVNKQLNKLTELFRERLIYDETKEHAFDKLYERMKKSEADLEFILKKELVMSLLFFYDDIVRIEDTLEQENPVKTKISSLKDELLRILYAQGVEPIKVLDNQFENSKQRAVGRIQISSKEEDMTVERVTREGFLWNEKVLRPQDVIVHRYDQKKEECK